MVGDTFPSSLHLGHTTWPGGLSTILLFVFLQANYVPPPGEAMNEIKGLIKQMEESFSPIKKLDYLLQIVTSVYNTVSDLRFDYREIINTWKIIQLQEISSIPEENE